MWSLRHTARSATLLGVFLALGAAGLAVVTAVASPIASACGSVMAGLGTGLTFNGNLRSIGEVTTADSRSEVFSAVYVVSYAALSLPSLAARLLAPSLGLRATSCPHIGFVGVLSLIALVHVGRSQAGGPVGHARPYRPGADGPRVPGTRERSRHDMKTR
jgi:hypothetical protein